MSPLLRMTLLSLFLVGVLVGVLPSGMFIAASALYLLGVYEDATAQA